MTQHDQVRTIMTEGDHLDDITRARMWSRIEGALAAPPAPRSHARTFALLGGAIAAAAVAILVVRGVRSRAGDRELAVAADATLTSHLGPHARAALVGPARLELLGPPGDATTAELHTGTLLAEFEGGRGRSLRIVAGDLTVDIVGTLFAVEVHDDDTACVSVSHGTVRVTRRDGAQLVTDRQQLCSGDPAPRAITPATEEALERHARTISIASTSLAPSSATTSPPPSAPSIAAAPPQPIASPPPSAPSIVPTVSPAPTAPSIATTPNVAAAAAPPSGPRAASIPVAPPAAPAATPPPSIAATAQPAAPEAAIPPPAVEPPTAEALYRAAETALAAGDPAAADRALARLLELPGTALADQALYERARIAYQARAYAVARGHLARLSALAGSPLAEPGAYLDCRIAVQAKDSDAERCLAAYRTAYPRSPHDLDVLAVLAQLTYARGGCTAARPARDELVTRYPRTDHAAAWRSRCPGTP